MFGTTSSILCIDAIRGNKPRTGAAATATLQKRLSGKITIICDEYSTISTSHWCACATQSCRAHQHDGSSAYGDFNWAFFGDLGQHFPPSGTSPLVAPLSDPGRLLFLQLRRVVWLDVVVRQTHDAEGIRLRNFLQALRDGNLTKDDLNDLNGRALGQPGMPFNLDDPRLKDAQIMCLRQEERHCLMEPQVCAQQMCLSITPLEAVSSCACRFAAGPAPTSSSSSCGSRWTTTSRLCT
jgi:hypothetical protein